MILFVVVYGLFERLLHLRRGGEEVPGRKHIWREGNEMRYNEIVRNVHFFSHCLVLVWVVQPLGPILCYARP